MNQKEWNAKTLSFAELTQEFVHFVSGSQDDEFVFESSEDSSVGSTLSVEDDEFTASIFSLIVELSINFEPINAGAFQ